MENSSLVLSALISHLKNSAVPVASLTFLWPPLHQPSLGWAGRVHFPPWVSSVSSASALSVHSELIFLLLRWSSAIVWWLGCPEQMRIRRNSLRFSRTHLTLLIEEAIENVTQLFWLLKCKESRKN